MGKRTAGEVRAEVIARGRKAFRAGVSASRFITEMRGLGLSYRRTEMLADWRSINEIEKKAGAMRFVRKDYFPAVKSMAQVEWALSQEYMYKVKVTSRVSPGEPLTERFVNIMSDKPMTPAMVSEMTVEKWRDYEKYMAELIE
ncbi:unnamed protein product, partial [marine sediment metagenome]